MRGPMDPSPLCRDFTFLQHEVCSDYFIHQHIHNILNLSIYFVRKYRWHSITCTSVWILPYKGILLPLIPEPQCFKLELTVIIGKEWLKIYSCQNTSIFTELYLFCGRYQCKTQCQLPEWEIISNITLEDSVNEAGYVCLAIMQYKD